MLIQFFPDSFEADLTFVSGIEKKDFASVRMPSAETWQKSLPSDQPWKGCKTMVAEGEMNNDDPCSTNFPMAGASSSSPITAIQYESPSPHPAAPDGHQSTLKYYTRCPKRKAAPSADLPSSSPQPSVPPDQEAPIDLGRGVRYSQMPTSSAIPRSSIPTFVYHRKKNRRNSAASCPAQTCTNTRNSDGSHSGISSEAHSVATKEHTIRAVDSKSETLTRCPSGEGLCSEETLIRINNPGALDTCCIIDSCSSSKSNLDLNSAPLKTDVEDLGECSSSGVLAAERLQDEISERAVCISIIYRRKRLRKVAPVSVHGSAEDAGGGRDNSRTLSCKVCEHPENTLKMIVCDNCNHAIHLSCCKPLMEEIPEDEWFCNSCTKKKQKIRKEKSTNLSLNSSSEIDRYRDSISENSTGRISLMLKDTKHYTSHVRIGSEFQAEVPVWSGPIVDEVDRCGEPLEITAAESLLDWNCKKPPRTSSIGNWIQCREVIEGIGEGDEETICGKWRRAPVFEVQTDNWECFRCVLWDPYHADCAVPQELDTDEVMKQLKYMEMLRPRLAAKRRKVERTKRVRSQRLTG